jgi:hypothetical protein
VVQQTLTHKSMQGLKANIVRLEMDEDKKAMGLGGNDH